MRDQFSRVLVTACAVALVALAASRPSAQPAGAAQPIDAEYTALIRTHLQDARISTDLVDHLPASATVPTPLHFLGRIVGTPGELTYARDIHRYFEALANASDRAALWRIGTSEEGRPIVLLAISSTATIRDLDRYRATAVALSDPRRTADDRARQLVRGGKPIYWIVSGLHSPENGGPEMLMELAYRLAVQESPFIRTIRENVITLITPVLEVDGREKQVDTYYFNKRRRAAGEEQMLPLMYWGKYVAHDNNRDGLGQYLALTQTVTRTFLEWKPTVLHDLHEQSTYLYTSTGTGPYNEHIDAITIGEWWLMAKTEVTEMTRRGVPGVWTYGFYDGWTPNYLFFIAHARNAIGRFYEVMGYGPENRTVTATDAALSREWFRPNPPLPSIRWGPRNNTNIQQSALLVALHHVAENRERYLENYWLKHKRAVDKGRTGPIHGWVIPAGQRRRVEAAAAVNALRRQGVEFHVATDAFESGAVHVRPGDYIVRGDQPYRTIGDMYFSVQNYPASNTQPYDDTGWTFQYMRNLVIRPLTDLAALEAPMEPVRADVRAAGGIHGRGPTLLIDHTTDNSLVTLRFRHAAIRIEAAREDFEAAGRHFGAGTFIVPQADRAALEPTLVSLGLKAWAVGEVPSVPTHEMDVPRIGLVHSWASTQNDGWVRAAFDAYGVPYTYLGDVRLREGRLRERFDVLVLPHVDGTPETQVNGIPKTAGGAPLPYRRTAETPHLGAQDEADDIRGGMGLEGVMALLAFVREGGTLITEGSSSALFPAYNLTTGLSVERPDGLFVRGSIVRGVVTDRRSPIAYGYDPQLPVYFNQEPVLNAGGPGGLTRSGGGRARSVRGAGMAATPMPPAGNRLSAYDPESDVAGEPVVAAESGLDRADAVSQTASQPPDGPRVVVAFPRDPDQMLLSGVLVGGEALAGRAQVVHLPIERGHLVSFAIRPFWRWQTHGTFFLVFNTLLQWNDLDAR